jgi:formate dehydrogenase
LLTNVPSHSKETISYMKKGTWLVNTARGALCVAQDVADAVASGHLAGYSGDVWDVQPSPADHCWRSMKGPNGNGNGMYVPPLLHPSFVH